MKKPTVSFLVSGRGSNFKIVADRILNGKITAECGAVISNKADAAALEIARNMKIPAYTVDAGNFLTRKGHEKEIIRLLEKHNTDLIVAAGYMRILSPYILKKYCCRIINIHPSLLPAFPGTAAQRQAIEYGVKVSGCTVHFIDEGTDTGPIILQKTTEIRSDDTQASLSKRILELEHEALPEAVKMFCEGRLAVEGRKVRII
ncbi:MAG: phosphoribosylglycinamide formyltransferase [Spirochaetota bacterium]